MYEEASYTEDHMEVDGVEMIAGSGGSSFMPYTSASDKEDGASDLGVHINLSNLIQVPKPSDRFTVTVDRSLINSLSVVPSSISSTSISSCGPSVSNSNCNPSNTITTVAAATLLLLLLQLLLLLPLRPPPPPLLLLLLVILLLLVVLLPPLPLLLVPLLLLLWYQQQLVASFVHVCVQYIQSLVCFSLLNQ